MVEEQQRLVVEAIASFFAGGSSARDDLILIRPDYCAVYLKLLMYIYLVGLHGRRTAPGRSPCPTC